jgi:hypothetical protein
MLEEASRAHRAVLTGELALIKYVADTLRSLGEIAEQPGSPLSDTVKPGTS